MSGNEAPFESQFEVLFSDCPHVYFAGELQVDVLEGSNRKCQLRDMVGTRGFLCSTVRSEEIPERPAMASEGPEGRGASCNVALSSFWVTSVIAVEVWWALLWSCSKEEGAHHPSTLRKGLRREEEPWGPLTRWQGYQPRPTQTPGISLTPGMLHTSSALLPPSTSSVPAKKGGINENPEEDQFEIKI